MDSFPRRHGSSAPPADGTDPRLFEFGPFVFDEERWELRSDGVAVDVPPKVMQTLALLLRNRERLVTTEELLAALWPTVTVTEASLTKAIRIARQVLNDDGEAQRYIRTTRGRGYRFVAEVVERPSRRVTIPPPSAVPRLSELGAFVAPGDEPFVGRDRELGELLAVLDRARNGRPGFVLVGGHAGAGKSRLLSEFSRRATATGVHVIWGRAWEEGGAPDLWPWIQILRGLLATRGVLGEAEADEVSRLLDTVVAPPPETATRTGPERFRAFDAIVSVLSGLGRSSPIVVILEDLQASDASTLTLTRFLVRDIRDAGVVVVGTYRSGEVHPDPHVAEPFRKLLASARVLSLDGLSEASTEALMSATMGAPPEPGFVSKVQRVTEGNPLFVMEIARRLAGSGARTMPLEDAEIPERIVEAVRARFEALPQPTRELLTLASVIGKQFELPVLQRVSALASGDVVRRLGPAVERGILTEVRGAVGTLAFSHMLLRDVLYDALGVAERAEIHRRIGEVLEASLVPEIGLGAARLSHHFLRASLGDPSEKAVRYAEAAGLQALGSFAFEEAVRHFEHALSALHFAEGKEAWSTDLLLNLGRAQRLSSDYASSRVTLDRALALARSLRDPVRFSRVALDYGEVRPESGTVNQTLLRLLEEATRMLASAPDGDPTVAELASLVDARLAACLAFAGKSDEAEVLSQRALDGARRHGGRRVLGHALNARHWVLWRPGTGRQRLALAEEMVRLDRGDEEGLPTLDARLCEITDLLELGDAQGLSRALATYERAADAQRDPSCLYNVRVFRAMRALMEGRFEDSERAAEEAAAAGSRIHPENAANFYGAQVWWIRSEQGRAAELEPLFRARLETEPDNALFHVGRLRVAVESDDVETARTELDWLARDDFAALPPGWAVLPSLGHAATACALLGDETRASALSVRLATLAGDHAVLGPAIVYLGPAAFYAGLCSLTLSAFDDAIRHFEEALAAAERLAARPFSARIQQSLADAFRLRNGVGDSSASQVAARSAFDLASSLGMARVARHAERTLVLASSGVRA